MKEREVRRCPGVDNWVMGVMQDTWDPAPVEVRTGLQMFPERLA